MDEVVVRASADGVAVAVGEVVLHTAENAAQAEQLAAWVRYQLAQGTSVDDVGKMLRGEAVAGGDPDLTVLEGTIGDLKAALATGEHDPHLGALIAAEKDGKARRGALSALEARQDEAG